MDIRYAISPCPLGRLLVAETGQGIAAVYLDDSARRLRAELEREFPGARIREDRKEMKRPVETILRHLCGRQSMLDLPLDVQGTSFQRRVWKELRRIPYGATRSYTEIARAIGKPRAVRAVAQACAANPVSIVIPCHRVVGKDGTLTGYSRGLERKRALLEMEKKGIQARPTRSARRPRNPRSHQSAHPDMAQASTIRAKRFAEIR